MSYAYRWPDGFSAAAALTFDLDGETPLLWRRRGEPALPLGELEQRRFGWRQGVHRILALLGEVGLRATFYVPGWIVARHPEVLREIASSGHSMGLHGWLHEPPTELSPARFRERVRRSLDAFESAGVAAPEGFRSPSWDMTAEALGVLAELGLRHDSSLMGYDHPYWVEGLVELPVDWHLDDAPFLRYVGSRESSRPVTVTQLFASWHEQLAAARRFGSLLMLTMHPWLSGRAGPAHALAGLLGEIARSTDVWCATADELARWHADAHAAAPRVRLTRLEGDHRDEA